MAEASTSASVTPLLAITEETPPLESSDSRSNARNYGTMKKISLLPTNEMSKSLDDYLEPFVKQRLGPLQGTFESLNGIDFGKRRLDIQATLEQYHRGLAEHHALGGKPRLLIRTKSDSELLSYARSRNLTALVMGTQAGVEPQEAKSVGIHNEGGVSTNRIEGAAS